MKQLIENLRDNRVEVSREECAAAVENLTAERDALKSALQLIKANTNTLDWPDDINAAIQGAGK